MPKQVGDVSLYDGGPADSAEPADSVRPVETELDGEYHIVKRKGWKVTTGRKLQELGADTIARAIKDAEQKAKKEKTGGKEN